MSLNKPVEREIGEIDTGRGLPHAFSRNGLFYRRQSNIRCGSFPRAPSSGFYSHAVSCSRQDADCRTVRGSGVRGSGKSAARSHRLANPAALFRSGSEGDEILGHFNLPSARNSSSTSASVKRRSWIRASETAPSSMSSASIDSAVAITSSVS